MKHIDGWAGALMATVLAVPLAAQAPGQQLTLTPYIGGMNPLTDPPSFVVSGTPDDYGLEGRTIEPGMLVAVSAGMRLDRLGVEVTAGYMPTVLGVIAGTAADIDLDLWMFTGTGMLHIPTGIDGFEPYIALGGGFKSYKFDLERSEWLTRSTLHVGGGLQYAFMDNVAIRLDVRDHMSRFEAIAGTLENERQHDLQFAVGLTFSTTPAGGRAVAALSP